MPWQGIVLTGLDDDRGMGKVGFEPTTTCVSDRCSTELSYSPKERGA